jgi:hypothetical protein
MTDKMAYWFTGRRYWLQIWDERDEMPQKSSFRLSRDPPAQPKQKCTDNAASSRQEFVKL